MSEAHFTVKQTVSTVLIGVTLTAALKLCSVGWEGLCATCEHQCQAEVPDPAEGHVLVKMAALALQSQHSDGKADNWDTPKALACPSTQHNAECNEWNPTN